MNLWSGEKMRQAGLAMRANQILNYWKATMWLPPEQTRTNNERGSQRSRVCAHLTFSPGDYLSFVSMSISGLIKEIVNAHSLTCIASVDELTPPYFLLSVIYNWGKQNGKLVSIWPVFPLTSRLDLRMILNWWRSTKLRWVCWVMSVKDPTCLLISCLCLTWWIGPVPIFNKRHIYVNERESTHVLQC